MKSKSLALKVFALINFVVLITAFLLYKGGYFYNNPETNSESVLTSPNGGTNVQQPKKDTSIKKADSINRTFLPSSKSLVISPQIRTTNLKNDSNKNTQPTSGKQVDVILGGSKSAIIFTPPAPQTVSTKNKKSKAKKPKAGKQ